MIFLTETTPTPLLNNATFIVGILTFIGLIISLIWNYKNAQKLNELSTDSTKNLLIHKLQFEKEFEIYQNIWGLLISIKFKIEEIHKIINDQPDSDASSELLEKWGDFNTEFDTFKIKVFESDPFCYLEVAHSLISLCSCITVLRMNLANQFTNGKRDVLIEKHFEYFEELSEDVSKQIQKRIHNIY